MLALWAASASPWRIGATLCEMNPDRPWVGSWRAVTSVILPADIVIWTWTSPNGSETTEPVNVPLPFVAALVGTGVAPGASEAAVDGAVDAAGPVSPRPGPLEASGAGDRIAGTPSAEALSAGVLKLNSRARAMAVTTIAATARFGMGSPDQNSKRSKWMWRRGMPSSWRPSRTASIIGVGPHR